MSIDIENLNVSSGGRAVPHKMPTIAPCSESCTVSLSFAVVSKVLSDRPLRHPRAIGSTPPNRVLRKLAEKFPPPPTWFEGDEESPI